MTTMEDTMITRAISLFRLFRRPPARKDVPPPCGHGECGPARCEWL